MTIDHRGASRWSTPGPDDALLTRLEELVDSATETEAHLVGCRTER